MVALMDTLSIYEQFRASLGEEKAKVFAQTLGTMIEEAKNAATKEDRRSLRDAVDANTARVDAALATLAQRMVELTARVDTLAERMDQLTAVVEKLAIRSDRHGTALLELKFRDRLPSYLGRYLRRAKVMQPADLLDEVEASLESAEVDDFLRADVLAQGTVDGESTYVIGEVSYTADAGDIERAARRAALLRKATLPAVGLVACEAARPETLAYAREQGVRVWLDGALLAERRE
jgi:polyhydroxyalkanoate synthesis regulator phasin